MQDYYEQLSSSFLTNSYYNNSMFGKARCKLCGDDVRFALRHLKQKHPEVLADKDVTKLNMSRVLQKYFDWRFAS